MAVRRREKAVLSAFLSPTGPPALLLLHQVLEEQGSDGEWVQKGAHAVLQVSAHATSRITGTACYLLRCNPKGVSERTVAEDVQCGQIKRNALHGLTTLIKDVFAPTLCKQEKWGKLSDELQSGLLKRVLQFGGALADAAESLNHSVELAKADAKLLGAPGAAATREAAERPEVVAECARVLKSWTATVRIAGVAGAAALAGGERPISRGSVVTVNASAGGPYAAWRRT